MNTNRRMQRQQTLEDRLGLRMAARLSSSANGLSHDVQERLRAAREQAVARRKQSVAVVQQAVAPAQGVLRLGDAAALGRSGFDPFDRWGQIATAVLVAALAIALVTVVHVQSEDRAMEVADVDEALLTDDLPPQAYTDPGFLQFLKTHRDEPAAKP